MKLKKRSVTTTETRSVTVIKAIGGVEQRCAECAATVWMASVEQAALLRGISARTVYRQVEAGKVHFAETPAGVLRVCLHSLLGGTNALVARIGAGDMDSMIESETVS